MRLKITIGSLILVAAISYLAVAGVKKGWVYMMTLDQFVDQPEYHARRVRINGKVASDGVDVSRAGLYARFTMHGEKNTLKVDYRGVVPDMFKEDHEVVVEGSLKGDVFHADVLMTKCASKYEADEKSPAVPANHKPVAPGTPAGSEKS